MEQYTSKKRVPPHVPKRDFVAIVEDHRKEVNRDLRVYNAEKSETYGGFLNFFRNFDRNLGLSWKYLKSKV